MTGWGRGCVSVGDCFQLSPIMAIVFVQVEEKLNFLFCLFRRGAEPMAAAQLTFERGYGRFWILARLWFDPDVGVGWFMVYAGGQSAILLSRDQNIKERY